MAEARRKLAAIMVADVAGYSRLMSANEENTVDALNERREIFRTFIEEYHGRVVDTAGDSVLATFDSVVEAVRCASDVQSVITDRNSALPEDRRMDFRIGVNLGDIIEQDDGTVYGDGVNVAARLEGLTDPGAITVSESVQMQLRGKVAFSFTDLGYHPVKNIAEPVHAYQIGAAGTLPPSNRRLLEAIGVGRRALAAAGVGVVILIAGLLWIRPNVTLEVAETPARAASIAVLPFENLSRDSEQAYLAEGLSVEIISAISRFNDLFVIDRNSSFAAAVRDLPVNELGEVLGVRYVLDGSLRGNEERLRVTVRLMETSEGKQIWTQSYEETLDNLLDVQDRITRRVVGAVAPRISEQEMRRVAASLDGSADAHDSLMRARYLLRQGSRGNYVKAREILKGALGSEPNHAALNAEYAGTLMQGIWFGWTPLPERDMGLVMEHANRAIEANPDYSIAHRVLGDAYSTLERHNDALAEHQLAVALNPNQAAAYDGLGDSLLYLCRFEEAATAYETAGELNPYPSPLFHFTLGLSYYFLGDYQSAAGEVRKCIERYPDVSDCYVVGTAVSAELNQAKEARLYATEVRRLDPFFDANSYGERLTCTETAERIRHSLRNGGLD